MQKQKVKSKNLQMLRKKKIKKANNTRNKNQL